MGGIHSDNTRFWRALLVLVMVGLVGGFVIGCSRTAARDGAVEPASEQGAMQTAADSEKAAMEKASESMASDANSQGCSACSKGEEPAPAIGAAQVVDGVQVVTVGIVDGYYTPNLFTVESDKPVKVVFKVEGRPAKACVSKPTFESLGKTVTVTEGEKSIDLGDLAPGKYEFSCGMGANVGSLTVQ